jgi:uncharacterized protein (TIGR02611 family)
MKRSREAIRRLILEVIGWTLTIGGLIAIPLPGPGLLMMLGGLAILSQQYEWAERHVRPVEVAALRAASDGVQSRLRIFLSLLGVLWLWGTGLLWTFRPPAPQWWPLAERWWLFGGFATGVTLVVSGFVALALIVYSVRRFRGSPYVPEVDEPGAGGEPPPDKVSPSPRSDRSVGA